MKMEGRRQSSNVEDRRGQKAAVAAGGLGIGGILIYLLISLFSGGNTGSGDTSSGTKENTEVSNEQGSKPLEVLKEILGGDDKAKTNTEQSTDTYSEEEWEKELRVFSSQVLAGTEDVWKAEFKKMGRTYHAPKLVIFSDAVNSGCGNATSAGGPFYCSADQCVYIDLTFFKNMKKEIGADGDFAYAYVIAHEVGHHVQNELGILQDAHQKMARAGKNTKEYNETSVRLELQADFFAGVWAYHDNEMFGSLEDGDIEEALNAAAKIGDDYLQKQAYGRTMPETFNHGTSAQRSRWLKLGISTGDINKGDTFSPSYSSL